MSGVRVAITGESGVYCVHDRIKRAIVSDTQLVALLLTNGEVFDPRHDRIHRCACCDNLFANPADQPQYCLICSGALVHKLEAPLPEPIGEVDG